MIPGLPYLAPWYRVARDGDRLVLEYGQRMVCFEGRAAGLLLPALLPLLDGTRTVDEIVRVLGEAARTAIENALATLSERGVLVDGPPLSSDVAVPVAETVSFLASRRPSMTSPAEVAATLSERTVAIVGNAGSGVEAGRLLRCSGVTIERADTVEPGTDLAICAPAPEELPLLGRWNRDALEFRRPWLQLLPFDGRYATVGPLYLPGDTACFECFRLRRAANLDGGDELSLVERAPATYPEAVSFAALLGGLATMVALDWLVAADHYLPAAFHAIELVPTIALTVHHVHRVPRCPECSELADVAPPLPWHKEIPVAHG